MKIFAEITQIVALFHTDLLENQNTIKYFENLSTLNITLEEASYSGIPRVEYTFRKSEKKIIKEVFLCCFTFNTI